MLKVDLNITSIYNKMSESTEDLPSNALVAIKSEYTSTPIGLTKGSSSGNCDKDNAPRILCNELIVDPHISKSLEKLDELSSLEQEIAKMHNIDDTIVNVDAKQCAGVEKEEQKVQTPKPLATTKLEIENSKEKNTNSADSQDKNLEDKHDPISKGDTALEHEDLIAVLKGLDGHPDETLTTHGHASMLEGVTIEGEGEYQIMEVVDDDSNATEDNTKPDDTATTTSDPAVQKLSKTKKFGSTALTAQEERALALEQMACLKNAPRSRKQDIKPIKPIDSALDLVSTLEADWSEHEDETRENSRPGAKKTKQSTGKNRTSEHKTNIPLITSVVVLPSVATATVSGTPTLSTTTGSIKQAVSSINDSTDVASQSLLLGSVIETKTEKDSQVNPSQSGFRRTRIIKRKIIWDPDAPETTFSYAKLVKPNSNKTPSEPIITTQIKKGSTTITPIKKETSTSGTVTATKKTQRPTTPKVKKPMDLNNEDTSSVKSENSNVSKSIIEKEELKSNKTEDSQDKVTANLEVKSSPTTNSPSKRRSQTPVHNGTNCAVSVKKKKITEVDRLMGDEGAVNMLNSLEKLEASLGSGEPKSTRPMMRSRAATICEKLPRKDTASPVRSTNTTPSTSTNPQTNKGKRGPKARGSSTWDYVYKKNKMDFDDSLIIRRRSNSSYSSTTSLNRLSLDGPPATIASNPSTKTNDTISLPASTNENHSSKTSSITSNQNKSSSKTRYTSTLSAEKTFEFARPESKKSQKRTKSSAATLTNDMKKAAPVPRRNTRSPATTNEDKGKEVTKTPSAKSPTTEKNRKDTSSTPNTISDVVVKKSSKVAQILFSTNKSKLSNTFTIQMLNKLVDILDKLATDPECHVIAIGTNDAHFCQGVDVTDLTTIATEKRKNYALNLATSVKNYLKTLATYPKPIIAGVAGNLMNLGVMQLALFDVVIAHDKTTFDTQYGKMGQTPEGYCIWHNMNKIRGSFKTKLFWLCEKVQSNEAALAGLVNKLTASNKVNDDALIAAKRIASLPAEPYRAMKKTAMNSRLDVIGNMLDDEFNAIIKQWTSNECLDNLRKYIVHD